MVRFTTAIGVALVTPVVIDASADPDLDYIAGLTRVRAAAGAVIRDEQGRVLVIARRGHGAVYLEDGLPS